MVNAISEQGALALRPAQTVRETLPSSAGAGARAVVDWFAALSEGRLDDAMAMMAPDGPYFLLRQRQAITNSAFGGIMAGLVGTTFTRPISWSLGAITEQEDRVAVMAGSFAPLVAGGAYENLYHFLFRMSRGLIFEVYEFGDTFRSAQTFSEPPGSG